MMNTGGVVDREMNRYVLGSWNKGISKPVGMLHRAMKEAYTKPERILLRAQLRAHRRLEKYCQIVRIHEMPWEESRRTRAWRLVREATQLVVRLRHAYPDATPAPLRPVTSLSSRRKYMSIPR
jgi:hypothetical protein